LIVATVRTLIHVPPSVRRGEVFEVRATLGHAMETGHRADGQGGTVARDIVNAFECQLDGVTVFTAILYPAIAANPYLSFWLRATQSGTLTFSWRGDRSFAHRETVALVVAG
jgi:sulfur-oxidizing protein SoxZ